MSLEDKIKSLYETARKLNEAKEEPKGLVDRFEDFYGKELSSGRITIKGFPVDMDGKNSDDDGISMDAVDDDAAKGLTTVLKKAGFKVKRIGKLGLLVESAKEDDEDEDEEDKDEDDVKSKKPSFLSKGKSKDVIKEKEEEDEEEDEEDKEKDDKEIKEAFGALFDGVDLSEEFKEKAATIFEVAVKSQVKRKVGILENKLAQVALDEQVSVQEGLVDKVDGYLDYMVEQWLKNNEIALERGIKAEIFESFVGKMRGVFVEHNINLPDEEFSLVESLQEKADALEVVLDEQVAENIKLTRTIKQYAKQTTIEEASKGMTDIDAEKFALLAEELQFDDEDSFAKKLEHIRENYVENKQKRKRVLDEDVTQESNYPVKQLDENVSVQPDMARYLKAL